MNPEQVFCPNIECVSRGQVGKGNIKVQSKKKKIYGCKVCKKTFSATKGTIFYRLKKEPTLVMLVLCLLAYGCPRQAIVVAFELDERTVKSWWEKGGKHCQKVHEYKVEGTKMDLGQVQADEIKAKIQGGIIWMAMAIMVSSRLWLGGVISRKRDKKLLAGLVGRIRKMALCRPLLIAVDGLQGYVGAFYRAFRSKQERNGQKGRCKLIAWSSLNLVQVIKKRQQGQLEIERRIVLGQQQQVTALIDNSQGQGGINTAFIERLNATFRSRLAPLARRSRSLAAQPTTLQTGMYLVGCLYNFCSYHRSLRIPFFLPSGGQRWLHRTPAIAAGLTNHLWSLDELFWFKIPPPFWTPPNKRGRPSKEILRLIQLWTT